jgi:hypothetical protein
MFGRVVVCHLVAGRDIADLSNALSALPNGPIISLPQQFNALAETAENGHAHARLSNDALMLSYAQTLPYSCDARIDVDAVHLTLNLMRPAARLKQTRVTLPQAFAKDLGRMAAKILVPESDVSRQSGAGAGLTDND